MTERNGKVITLLFRILGAAMVMVMLYLVQDMKTDIREIRASLENHVIELQKDVNKIKGKLGIDD